MTVQHCQPTQTILMMKTMLKNKDKTLRLVNELVNVNGFNDFLSLADVDQIVHLRDNMIRNHLCECEV